MGRILHVCTFEHGGAAIAARRQSDALRSIGLDSTFMALRVKPIDEVWEEQSPGRLVVNVPESIWSYHGALTAHYYVGNRTRVSNTWFSLWPTETALDDVFLAIFQRYDILHFHWTSGIFSTRLADALRSSGKRILFTNHDMNYFTGGCHYDAGCGEYRRGCRECAQIADDPLRFVASGFDEKIRALDSLKATWLFPSVWLSSEFKSSQIGEAESEVIPNCANTELFYPVSKKMRELLRARLGFAPGERIIVAGAQDNREKRKGFGVLEQAISALSAVSSEAAPKVAVVTFGSGKPELPEGGNLRHVHLGTISEDQVAELFQSSDLIAFPSFEDNFPNVILEGLLCACPVLAFRIGGVPDIVEHGVNGYIVEGTDAHGFCEALTTLVCGGRISELANSAFAWAKRHQARYSPSFNAEELRALYEKVKPLPAVQTHVADRETEANNAYRSVFSIPREFGMNSGYGFAKRLGALLERSRLLQQRHEGPVGKICPAIWLEVPEKEFLPEMGVFHWTRTNNRFLFVSGPHPEHRLLLQIPARGPSLEIFSRAAERLSIIVNGRLVSFSLLPPQYEDNYAYVTIELPGTVLAEPRWPNVLDMNLTEPTVPLSEDPRGLGFIFSNFKLVSLAAGCNPTPQLLALVTAEDELSGVLDHDTVARIAADFLNQARRETVEAPYSAAQA